MTLFSPSASDALSQQTPSRLWLGEQSLMAFHQSPSPSPGGDEKVMLIFQRSPINYSTGLCIAHSLHLPCRVLE